MSPLDKDYPVVIQQKVIWGEMDPFNHVNNTVYFRYFENIRMEYFQKAGVFSYLQENRIGPILAHTECNFRLPLDFPDTIHIGSRCQILSEKKFNMDYVVYSEKFGKIAADGSGLIVFYDYNQMKSCALPDEIAENIRQLG